MKRRTITAMTMAGALAVGLTTFGQTQQAPDQRSPQQQQQDDSGLLDNTRRGLQQDIDEATRSATAALEDHQKPFRAAEADEIIGKNVENRQGDKIGDVKDLAVDWDNSRIAAVVISRGGILGVGEQQVAVPPSQLEHVKHDDDEKIILDVDKETFKSAPAFRWDDEDHSQGLTTSYRHFGQEPWQPGDTRRQPVRDLDTQRTVGDTARDVRDDVFGRDRDQATDRIERHLSLHKASDLLRADVNDSMGENVGRLDDMIVDLESGHLIAAVVGRGGILGVGQTLHALPPGQMTFDAEDESFTLRMTKEQLETSPEFTREQRQNLDNRQWVENLYSHYQETVPWETDRQPVRDPYDTERPLDREFDRQEPLDRQEPGIQPQPQDQPDYPRPDSP